MKRNLYDKIRQRVVCIQLVSSINKDKQTNELLRDNTRFKQIQNRIRNYIARKSYFKGIMFYVDIIHLDEIMHQYSNAEEELIEHYMIKQEEDNPYTLKLVVYPFPTLDNQYSNANAKNITDKSVEELVENIVLKGNEKFRADLDNRLPNFRDKINASIKVKNSMSIRGNLQRGMTQTIEELEAWLLIDDDKQLQNNLLQLKKQQRIIIDLQNGKSDKEIKDEKN